jgi:transcriptional regulator with XRE-family HTH domain
VEKHTFSDWCRNVAGARVKELDHLIGDRVRLARAIKRMSQEKLAGHLGVTFQQVQKYEKGTNRISASTLFQIAKVLEVDILFFFGNDAGNAQSLPFEFAGATSTDFRIMRGLLKVKDGRGKSGIAQLVEALQSSADAAGAAD